MNEIKTHIDLFSGIGGFVLAARWAGIKTVQFVEIDKFCHKVLQKNFPGVPIHDDIHEFRKICKRSGRVCNRILHTEYSESLQNNTAGDVEDTEKKGMHIQEQSSFWGKEPFLQGDESFGQSTESLGAGNKGRESTTEKDLRTMRGFGDIQEWEDKNTGSSPRLQQAAGCNVAMPEMPPQMAHGECPYNGDCLNERPFILTAGTPCQPASCAGKRRGTKDDRWLWGETFRVIAELQPKWCILENVRGLLSLESGVVFDNLFSELENIGYETRAFIIPACAVNAPHRRDRVWIVGNAAGGAEREKRGFCEGKSTDSTRGIEPDCHAADTNRFNGDDAGYGSGEVSQFKEAKICGGESIALPNGARSAARLSGQDNGKEGNTGIIDDGSKERNGWKEPWLEVATRTCTLDDGLPTGLVRPKGWRVNSLKALGNAIVPQVAFEIMKAILRTEE
ncbi:MAG: DNA cytosine methyltransferase [Smithella sp.]